MLLEKRKKRVEILFGEPFRAQMNFNSSSRSLKAVRREGKTVPGYPGYGWKSELDICDIAGIVFANERRRSLFDGPSKAARLRDGARLVAIESDRFSTGR